jgi:hypothetical protein
MNIPNKTVLISFLAISIAAGILLYPGPGRAATTRITSAASYVKIIEEPVIDFDIQFGEPGEDPGLSTVFLGSSVMASVDQQPSDLPKDAGKNPDTLISWGKKWLFHYLNKYHSVRSGDGKQ